MSDLFGKKDNEITLLIEDKEIVITSARLLKTMDTCADAFTCVMPWFPGLDEKLDYVTRPYSYSKCKIYIAGVLQMEGILYTTTHRIDDSGRIKELEIYSRTADIIDSSVRYPFEERRLDLAGRCRSQMNSPVPERQFDMKVVIDPELKGKTGGVFARIDAKQTENCFEKLQELAAQRNLLLSNTIDGDLYITRAKTTGIPIGTIEEGKSLLPEKFEAKFDGRKRWRKYEAVGCSSKSKKTKSVQKGKDHLVTRPRFLTFDAPDSLPGEAVSVVEWKKNTSAAESLNINFPVNDWYGPDGKLWAINTLVNVKSETLSLKKGFTFLITKVEFIYSESGATAALQLISPSMYSTGEIIEPWN